MSHVVKRDGDLYADGGVVLLKTEVIVLEVIELGKAAVLAVEGDLRSPEIAGFTEGGLEFGASHGVGGVDCRTGDRGGDGEIGRDGGEGGDAIAGGAEGLRGKTDEAGQVGPVGVSFILSPKPGKAHLRGSETRGGEIDRGILAGVETVLNDVDEAVSEALLLLERCLPLHVAIECEVGDGSILGYAFTNVFEVEVGGIERSPGGAKIVALRVAED